MVEKGGRKLCMNLGTTRVRCRPTNRWQDEVREEGRIVGAEGWQEIMYEFGNNKSEM